MAADREVYVTEIARLFPQQGEWDEEDYFALPETLHTIELSDGILTLLPTPTIKHQEVLGNLMVALHTYLEAHPTGKAIHRICTRLKDQRIRQPDLLYLMNEHRDRRGEFVYGVPDWVAEIIDEVSRHTDEVDKLAEYAEAGIPEYWLLDSKAVNIRVYVLREGASEYILNATYKAGEIARSVTIPGFEVAVDKILPDQLEE